MWSAPSSSPANQRGDLLARDQPLLPSAIFLLGEQFAVVGQALPAATVSRADEAEPIHQMRVAVRRCETALEMLSVAIPGGARREILKTLAGIRRIGGRARDLNVERQFLEHLLSEADSRDLAVVDLLYERATLRREALHPELIRRLNRAAAQFQRQSDEIQERLLGVQSRAVKRSGILREVIVQVLTQALESFLEIPPTENSSVRELHRLRVRGRQLRYGCELFATPLGREFVTASLPHLVRMQELLGTHQDACLARERLRRLLRKWKVNRHKRSWDHKPQGLFSWHDLRGGLKFVSDAHREVGRRARKEFQAQWSAFADREFREPLKRRLHLLAGLVETD